MKLTAKQQRFCDHYLISLNATQAAIQAGYAKRSAKEIGCENLTKPNIKAYIQSKQQKTSEKLECTKEFVVGELLKIAGFKASDLYSHVNESGGTMKDWDQIDSSVVKEVHERHGKDGDTWVEIKTHDKTKALELLAKHLGMFVDKVELKMPQPVMVNDPSGKPIFKLGVKK